MIALMDHWRVNVAQSLSEAALALSTGSASSAKVKLGTALAYLLRAAADGDDDAFSILSSLREAIETAEPTQRLTWEPVKR